VGERVAYRRRKSAACNVVSPPGQGMFPSARVTDSGVVRCAGEHRLPSKTEERHCESAAKQEQAMIPLTPPDNTDGISHNRDARHAPTPSGADVAPSARASITHRAIPWLAGACADDDPAVIGSDDPDAGFVCLKPA